MRLLIAIVFLLGLSGCEKREKPILPVSKTGELVVLTRNSPTTYYEDADGNPAGLEYDLVEMFAKELGVKATFIVAQQFDQIIPDLRKHKAHIAAAGLSITNERRRILLFAPPYQSVTQQLIYNTESPKPDSLNELITKKIEVVAGSSYVERLREARVKVPALKWTEVKNIESEDLLEKLSQGLIDYVVADSNIVDVSKNFYPNLGVAFTLGAADQLAWAFPKDAEPFLLKKAESFFNRIRSDGTLKRLLDRYYGHVKRLERADISGILEKMRTDLPHYRQLFQQAQEISGIDWRLIAALGYQESHWDPLATSPTGVRGLMMLTEDTADRMGVDNRLDPKQNISGGARYLVEMKDMIPARISEPDRTWLALAAYNVGYGHLEDARILAQRQKLSPDTWADIKKMLPLLSKTEYHSTTKHGYARGGEPVIFTDNVHTYYDILVKFEKPYKPVFPSFEPSKLSNNHQDESLSKPPT